MQQQPVFQASHEPNQGHVLLKYFNALAFNGLLIEVHKTPLQMCCTLLF
jgi:hypothetical protein